MRAATVLIGLALTLGLVAPVHAQKVLAGADAFGTWKDDSPGVSRHGLPTCRRRRIMKTTTKLRISI